MSNQLVNPETITERVKKRDDQAEIILKILDLAKQLDHCNHEVSEKVRFSDYINEKDIDDIRQKLDQSFWVQTLDECQVEKFLTTTDKEKLFESLEKDTPTFNEKNVLDSLESFRSSKGARATDMISKIYKEVTDAVFRVGNKHQQPQEKRLQLGICKAIRMSIFYRNGRSLPSYISSNNSNFNIIDDLERACYLVDGKTQPDRSLNITALTDLALRKNEMFVDGPYFTLKIFLNGNVLLKFKSLKVLETLNKWGRENNTLGI